MERGYALHIMKCEKFQKHVNHILSPSQKLATMISPWLFAI